MPFSMANNIFLILRFSISEFIVRKAGLSCTFLILIDLCLGCHLLLITEFPQFVYVFILTCAKYQSSSLLHFLHYLIDFFCYYFAIRAPE